MILTFDVTAVTEHDDGSATIEFDLSHDALIAFARLGLQHALIEAAKKVTDDEQIAEEDAGDPTHDGGEREALQAARAPA